MKAARKVGDAKKHECAFPQYSTQISSNPLRSEARVLGLIGSSPPVILYACSLSQQRFRTPPEGLLQMSVCKVKRKGANYERPSTESRLVK